MQPRLDVLPSPEVEELRDLMDFSRQLDEQRATFSARRATASPSLLTLLEPHLEQLEQGLKAVELRIHEHIYNNSLLRTKFERLQQLQGCDPALAATLLAYLPELGLLEDVQISGLVGVAPHAQGGRVVVRNALYTAAIAATKCNPILSAFHHRLLAQGKPDKVCLLAVMRKMIVALNRLLKDPDFTPGG